MIILENQDEINLWSRVYAGALSSDFCAENAADRAVAVFRTRILESPLEQLAKKQSKKPLP
jgi:hypothetical protein